jgi:uncharacterized protein GlcG (DUF336 family)
MSTPMHTVLMLVTILLCIVLAMNPSPAAAGASPDDCDGIGLTAAQAIIQGAKIAAAAMPSSLRTPAGASTQMRIAIVGRDGNLCAEDTTSADAWLASISIARGKAFTAVALSSNENALSSRIVGLLARPDGPGSKDPKDVGTNAGVAPLFGIGNSNRDRLGIITFAGGVPIYSGATLVGAIGVSGDGVDEDEQVAICGVENASGTTGLTTPFSPPLPSPCQ